MTICVLFGIYIFFTIYVISFLVPPVLAALHAPLHNAACEWDSPSLNPASDSCLLRVLVQSLKVI